MAFGCAAWVLSLALNSNDSRVQAFTSLSGMWCVENKREKTKVFLAVIWDASTMGASKFRIINNTHTHHMKTLLETYRSQVSSDSNYQSWESMVDESTDRLVDLKYKSHAYNKLCAEIDELSAYRTAQQDYEKTVQALADATGDYRSPEHQAIGNASDNVEAKVYSALASEQFIETLSYYIDCGVECESGVEPVSLPTFKF